MCRHNMKFTTALIAVSMAVTSICAYQPVDIYAWDIGGLEVDEAYSLGFLHARNIHARRAILKARGWTDDQAADRQQEIQQLLNDGQRKAVGAATAKAATAMKLKKTTSAVQTKHGDDR